VRLDVKVDWEQLAGILEDGRKMALQKPSRGAPRVARAHPASRTRKSNAIPKR